MQNDVTIYANKKAAYQLFGIIGLLISMAIIFYGSRTTDSSSLIAFIFPFPWIIYCTYYVIRLLSEQLRYDGATLTRTNAYRTQSVQLNRLVSVSDYRTFVLFSKRQDSKLKFHDAQGSTVLISVGDYDNQDFKRLIDVTSPYIFKSDITKNFLDLNKYTILTPPMPNPSPLKILKTVILFMLLPAGIVTATIVYFALRSAH